MAEPKGEMVEIKGQPTVYFGKDDPNRTADRDVKITGRDEPGGKR